MNHLNLIEVIFRWITLLFLLGATIFNTKAIGNINKTIKLMQEGHK